MPDEADIFWGRCSVKTAEEKAASPFVYDHESPEPHWEPDNTCSHCGGLRPSVALEAMRKGAKVVPTDKNYKIYVEMPEPKVGQMRVVGVMNHTPDDDSAQSGWVKADPAVLKEAGWSVGEDDDAQWMRLEPYGPTTTTKCYLNHFSEAQAIEFVVLAETKKMNLATPGHFYSGLCFGIYKDAIDKAVKALPPQPPPIAGPGTLESN